MKYKGSIQVFITLSFLLIFSNLEAKPFHVGAYYQNYSQHFTPTAGRPPFSPEKIDPGMITELYFAFACIGYITKAIDPENPRLTGDFTIQPTEPNDHTTLYPAVIALKKRSPSLKVMLSIGGWNLNNPADPNLGQYTYQIFSQMISSKENRKQFIDSAISIAHQYGFDGIDIDWEYPGDLTRGSNETDLNLFEEFLHECSTAFKAANPPLLLGHAVPAAVPYGLPEKYRNEPKLYFQMIARWAQWLDTINIMAYDYHVPHGNPMITGVNAPLSRDTAPESPYYIAKTLDNYLGNGVPAEKLVLGLPIYGHSFSGVKGAEPGQPYSAPGAPGPYTKEEGLLSYLEISDSLLHHQLEGTFDSVTSTMISYNRDGLWISHDNPKTIELKVKMAKDRGLKGVYFWAIDLDEYYWLPVYPNIRAAKNALSVSSF